MLRVFGAPVYKTNLLRAERVKGGEPRFGVSRCGERERRRSDWDGVTTGVREGCGEPLMSSKYIRGEIYTKYIMTHWYYKCTENCYLAEIQKYKIAHDLLCTVSHYKKSLKSYMVVKWMVWVVNGLCALFDVVGPGWCRVAKSAHPSSGQNFQSLETFLKMLY